MSTLRYLGVTGGCLRPNGFELGEGKYYEKARLLKLDLQTGAFVTLIEKSEGGQHYPTEDPNQQFTGICIEADVLWLTTDTEVFKYTLSTMELQNVFSHPCFHNIHSAYSMADGLYVTSTGLDNVVVLNKESGAIEKIFNSEGKDPWHRFDPDTDYRLVHSTRPHATHPNFVFEIDGNAWVTRCTQMDGVLLGDVSQRIDITGDETISVHDGVRWGDKIVFTRVDGFLVVCDSKSRTREEKIEIFGKSRNRPAGWCRGLYIDGDLFYVGYSKLRKTKLSQKLRFLSKGNFKYSEGNNSLVVVFNMRTRQVDHIYHTEDGVLDAIYGLVPLPND